MPKIVVPSTLDTRLYNTLRNIVNELEDTGTNIPLLKTLAQVRNIPNETSAYLFLGGKLYRYTKVDGKLFREEVDDGVIPSAYGTVLGDPISNMPIDIRDDPIVISDPVDPIPRPPTPTPTDPTPPPIEPTEITITDIIDDSVGDIRVNLLEAREISPNGTERIPVVFVSIDGKLYYCAEGTYFNKYLNIDVTIGDDTTPRETQRPTVSIDAPSTHSGDFFIATILFSREVSEFTESEIQVSGATLRDFSGSGRTYKVEVVPSGTDNVRLFIPANIVRDRFLLHNIASDRITVSYQVVDTTRPTISIFAPASYQGTTAIPIRIRSSEVVSGLTGADPVIVGGTLSNFQPTGMTNTVYTADITPTGSGIITIDVPENVCQDADGNQNTAARQQRLVTVPTHPRTLVPGVDDGRITIRWVAPASDNGSPIQRYEVRYDTEDWIDVGRNRFYTFEGLTNGQQYNLQARAVNNVGYSPSISTRATPVAGDTTKPGFTITAPATYSAAFDADIVATESVRNFTSVDVTATNATVTSLTTIVTGTTFRARITPSGTDVVTIHVAAGVAEDLDGNENLASNTVSVAHAPTSTAPLPPRSLSLTARDTIIDALWEEPISNGNSPLIRYEVQIDSGSWMDVGLVTHYTIRGLVNGQTYTIRVRAVNAVGESASIETTATPVSSDTTPPTIQITAPVRYQGSTSFPIGITASEPIFNLMAADINVVGGGASNLLGSGNSRSATITPTGDRDIQISIPANVAQDSAGNGNIASDTVTVVFVNAATVPDPPSFLRLATRDSVIQVIWGEPSSDGGAPIDNYEVRLDSGNWINVGVRTTHFFRNLANGQAYTVSVRVRNSVGYSTVISATATPTAPPPGNNVSHRVVIDFDNNIIGDAEAEEKFWTDQGMSLTCGAVAVGSALASLGVVDDPLQVVKDATKIATVTYVDPNNRAAGRTLTPLGDIVIDQDGNSVRNTPTLTWHSGISGRQYFYWQEATPIPGTNRYTLGKIRWWNNQHTSPDARLLLGDEESEAFRTWRSMQTFAEHYGAQSHTGYAYDFTWLVRELERGNKVIAFIDAYELWQHDAEMIRTAQSAGDLAPIQVDNDDDAVQLFGLPNHAVWITGIDLKDPSNPRIIINDSARPAREVVFPRNPDALSASYSFKEFISSWEDAEFIYTAIGSDELPDTPTIDGAELDREHREISRILRLYRNQYSDLTGVETVPFFSYRHEQSFLQQIGIADRYNAYVEHIAREQQRIMDAYGLDPDTFANVLDVLDHE